MNLSLHQIENTFDQRLASEKNPNSLLLVNLSKINRGVSSSFCNLVVIDASEPDAASRALSVILPMYKIAGQKKFLLVINGVRNTLQGPSIFKQILELVSYLPDISLNYLGDTPSRKYLSELLIEN